MSAWAAPEITWGIFEVPAREIGALGDVAGLDVIELGCGTAYFSAWLARRGARCIGVVVTAAQLDTARRCQRQFGVTVALVEADGAAVPLRDASCDLVVSEYGASVWCDPQHWIREAARFVRPGGGVEFHPGHGGWIQLLRANGFVVEALHELYAPAGAPSPQYYDISSARWASQWPIADLWVARRAPSR